MRSRTESTYSFLILDFILLNLKFNSIFLHFPFHFLKLLLLKNLWLVHLSIGNFTIFSLFTINLLGSVLLSIFRHRYSSTIATIRLAGSHHVSAGLTRIDVLVNDLVVTLLLILLMNLVRVTAVTVVERLVLDRGHILIEMLGFSLHLAPKAC